MGKRYLLDTNTVLDYMGNKLPGSAQIAISQIIDDEINISAINKIELLGFFKVEQYLIDFVYCSNILPIDDGIIDKTIDLRRLYKIKLPDAIIAATALYNSFTLVTNNTKDFKNILELDVLNPYEL
ncbi:MAG: type II toxin-antitoxin system VapC family toxin [Bacteroidetes bacterium]|nr:type II toxin-antitoxin system VapC family toxin [Bacteroidales bacterium]NJO69207.1 type II toxin-antitoxin system VapC family toxin [Bacteroidota bacterium]